MNWDMLAAVAELVGALAVVASLVYLARQVRFSGRQILHQNHRDTGEVMNIMTDLIASSPELAAIFVRGTQDFNELEEVERVRFSCAMNRIFNGLEQSYFGRRTGDWPTWSGDEYERGIDLILSSPGIREWWQHRRQLYTDDFRAYVDSVAGALQSASAPKADLQAKATS